MDISLDSLKISEMMDAKPLVCEDSDTVGIAAEALEERRVDFVVVQKEGKPLRILTRNDFAVLKGDFFDAPGQEERLTRIMCLPLSELNPNLILNSVSLDDSVRSVLQKLVEADLAVVAVLDADGKLAGLAGYHEILGGLVKLVES